MGSTLNLSWITEKLAVGGCFPAYAAPELARSHGVSAVVDLRVEERDDEALLRQHGIELLHLPTRDLSAVSLPMLRDGVRFVNGHLDQERRVLIHCQHGIGRSATLALCVMVSRGFEPLQALELAKSRRPCVSPSPPQFEAFASWMREELRAEPPRFQDFAAIAYRHLRGAG